MDDSKIIVKEKSYINSFRGLEVLRFVLSFAVIIWHYQHFFYPFVPFSHRELFFEKQPFFESLELFYSQGLYAVHIFWFISGLIFYLIYSERICAGKIKFNTYMLNRFSRLYPLHFVMLILVALLQHFYFAQNGNYFIYQENTVKNFVLNILFTQTWGLNKFSFNGPTWSVSIEMLVYIIFFVLAGVGFLRKGRGVIVTFIFLAFLKRYHLLFLTDDIVTCFYFFFAGCVFVYYYNIYQQNTRIQVTALATLIVTLIALLKATIIFPKVTEEITAGLDIDILLFSIIAVLSFLLLFNLKIFDRITTRSFQFIGNLTYSTYLVHFPIQLAIYIMLRPSAYSMFFSKGFFVIYMCTVFVFGKLFYEFFELPIQKIIRNKFSNTL